MDLIEPVSASAAIRMGDGIVGAVVGSLMGLADAVISPQRINHGMRLKYELIIYLVYR